MTDTVIRAENLGKRYLIGHNAEPERYTALRDVIARGARGLARSAADLARGRPLVAGDTTEEFWALRDVSFEVKRGEVVGIIGRNGAGKSTLLKVLSRITEPTEGRVTIKGRVASLLEVGTGFHPELTGRENIYLNGAILGMTRAEIRARFDEIVAFAEVERFLDTPVKRYSSGMYVRLAFAVAAYLEPEILVVDEVLAVGDAEFQRKCLGKMGDIAGHGRTVLFVSHNMGAIRALCQRSLLILRGMAIEDGDTAAVIQRYISSSLDESTCCQYVGSSERHKYQQSVGYIKRIILSDKNGSQRSIFNIFDPFTVTVEFSVSRKVMDVYLGFSFVNQSGQELMGTTARHNGISPDFAAGTHVLKCTINPNPLLPGRYGLRAAVFQKGKQIDHVDEALRFDISEVPSEATSKPDHIVGEIYLPYKWTAIGE
jgi:lipopolysaccharide transport system ATP-binding protein